MNDLAVGSCSVDALAEVAKSPSAASFATVMYVGSRIP